MGAAGRRTRGPAVRLGVSGASLAGALVLLWWLLPFGADSGADTDAGAPTSTSSPKSSASSAGSANATAPAAQRSTQAQTASLLTPEGIRTAIQAFKKETGRTRFGDFTVYPEYVSAELMVNGSDTKYDSYTYRPGKGVEKGIINGTLSGGEQPVSLDGFNWDRVPALLEEADKKLNVADPENRYLLVRQPNDIFDSPAGMAVYLTDSYGQAGYLDADTQGKVTGVSPAED